MKLYYLPNEGDPSSLQVGPRHAFETLKASGHISELKTFPFLWEAKRLGSDAAACKSMLEQVHAFQPDILFWQHVGDFQADAEFVRRLRQVAPRTLLAYHEGDAYGGGHKPYLKSMKALIGGFDLVFQVAMGAMKRLSEKAGARHIHWAPSTFDAQRFGGPAPASITRAFDAVMIGRLIRRIPYLWEFPGAIGRVRLAEGLSKALGDRFALYGPGWTLPCCHGAIAYTEQQTVIQQSWISVMWDHYPELDRYFSDRLPIALAAGVPHVTGYHPGYDELFGDCRGLIAAKTVKEAVDATLYLLSLDRRELMQLGASCREFAFQHFEATHVFTNIFNTCLQHLPAKARGATRC